MKAFQGGTCKFFIVTNEMWERSSVMCTHDGYLVVAQRSGGVVEVGDARFVVHAEGHLPRQYLFGLPNHDHDGTRGVCVITAHLNNRRTWILKLGRSKGFQVSD